MNKEYKIRQMIIECDSLAIPELDWEYSLELNSIDFFNIMHEIQDMSEACEIKIKNKMIQFKANGIIGELKIKTTPNVITVNTEDKFLKMGFSTKYLYHYTKARNISDRIQINFSKDTPIKLTYELDDGGFIYNFIAPKIQ